MSTEPPEIPFSYDAFLQWKRWPYLRIGVRPLMRSTFDRRGGNHYADAGHHIRLIDDRHSVTVDETGPGILWFVRHNHWHGSPWDYRVDGQTTIVQESSTPDPVNPVEDSIFEPKKFFPQGLTYTWSVTKGADLSWVPIPFEEDFRMTYGRPRYSTGYYIFWKVPRGLKHLSRPLESWGDGQVPPEEVLALIGRSGTDIAPQGDDARTHSGEISFKAHEPKLVWSSNAGPTMVRRIAFRVPEQSAPQLADARLRIYWDEREEPSVDAPLGLFFGAGSLLRDEGQEYIVKSFPMTIKYEDGEFLFATYFPMPFHKSARIEVAEKTGNAIDGVKWEVRTVPYNDPPNHVGLFHATYRDFPHPEQGTDLELLDTRTVEGGGPWCGHIVGTTYIFTQSGFLQTLEGDPRFYMDDSLTPQGQGTGSEEWGGGGDYWGGRRMTLPFAGHPVGRPADQMKTDLDRIHSAYRFLLSDLLPFGRNARFTLEHGGTNDVDEHYETVTYWYGLQQPALVLTDEFNVGDPRDERLHDYDSADATEPVTVSSRHQVGVDHIPLSEQRMSLVVPQTTDRGRRTQGTSEFTLAIRPDNLGVMLRRRLDLDYPNQKARVYVAEVSSDEPDWQEAGIWYTAGGSTAVFVDPDSIPEEKREQHVELMPPVRVVWDSNRRWRDEEFLIPPELTAGLEKIRVKVEYMPVNEPLFPNHPLADEAWTEFRYWAYCFVMPGIDAQAGRRE